MMMEMSRSKNFDKSEWWALVQYGHVLKMDEDEKVNVSLMK